MKYSLTRPALSEFGHLVDHILKDSPSAAADCADTLEAAFRSICETPHLGRLVDEEGARVLTIPRFRVRIFYEVADDEIVILSVFHTSRNPDHSPA